MSGCVERTTKGGQCCGEGGWMVMTGLEVVTVMAIPNVIAFMLFHAGKL